MIVLFFLAATLAAAPRPPSNVPPLFIPVVAHSGRDVSELRLFNGGTRAEEVTMIFTPDGADGTTTFSTAKVIVPAKHVVSILDVVATRFLASGAGSLELTGDIPDVIATSRIGSQLVPPMRYAAGGGNVVMLESTPDVRSELAMTELGGGRGTVHVKLIDADGNIVSESNHDILPFGRVQFPVSGAPLMRAELAVTSGTAKIVAYGSLVDRRSGTATLSLTDALGAGGRKTVPITNVGGKRGTRWRTEMVVWSLSAAFHFDYTDARTGHLHYGYEYLHGQMVHIDDVVESFGGLHEAEGALQMWLHGYALMTFRTYTIGPDGRKAELTPTADVGYFASFAYGKGPQQLLFAEQNAAARTNLGAIGGDNYDQITLRFTLFDADGNALGSTLRTVGHYQLIQFPLSDITKTTVSGGRIEVEIVAPSPRDSAATAWASVIDNATGAPMFVPLQ